MVARVTILLPVISVRARTDTRETTVKQVRIYNITLSPMTINVVIQHNEYIPEHLVNKVTLICFIGFKYIHILEKCPFFLFINNLDTNNKFTRIFFLHILSHSIGKLTQLPLTDRNRILQHNLSFSNYTELLYRSKNIL
jgi:hypothetical protein